MSLRITFLRHGNADKNSADHRLHPLSEVGKKQAMARREALGLPNFDLVINSPLRRTKETAMIVAGLDQSAATIAVPALFPEKDHMYAPAMDKAFEKLGHAPLRDYWAIGAEKAITFCALEAQGMIALIIDKTHSKNILIVGHGMLIQALCMMFAECNEPFMTRVLKECEGYRLTLADDGSLERIEIIE